MDEKQRKNVASFYDKIAEIYDESYESKAEYQIPRILLETYEKYAITEGVLLDIGCGTGKLKEYLGKSFEYKGIDISPVMIERAKDRGFITYTGAVEDIIGTLADKSVDHITALSSLYFIKDCKKLIKEFERVARKSFFVSLEHFKLGTIKIMKERGIDIYNHSASVIPNPTEIIKNVLLWKRPNADDRICGDLVFKEF